jgi:hypothetical protein
VKGQQEARGQIVTGQQEARGQIVIGQQEARGQMVTGQPETQDREATGLKEEPGRNEADSIGPTGQGEDLKEPPAQGAKDRGKGPHLATDRKAGVASAGIATVILVSAEALAVAELGTKAEPGSNGHKVIALKDQEIMKVDRKKLFFKKTGAHQKVSF